LWDTHPTKFADSEDKVLNESSSRIVRDSHPHKTVYIENTLYQKGLSNRVDKKHDSWNSMANYTMRDTQLQLLKQNGYLNNSSSLFEAVKMMQ
jgi:hypothetical protein